MDITLKGVTKQYGSGDTALTILLDVDAAFHGGKSYAVTGPSGIGKSTLLHLLARLDNVTAGEVYVGERCISALSEEEASRFRRDNVGMIFQFHHLLPEFTAEENVALPLLIQGEGEQVAKKRALHLLERVGVSARRTHYPSQLSGGEQQRVAIARAIVSRPPLILADEPTGNLDPQNAESIAALLRELVQETNGTLIVVTHSQELARLMDVEYRMERGGRLIHA